MHEVKCFPIFLLIFSINSRVQDISDILILETTNCNIGKLRIKETDIFILGANKKNTKPSLVQFRHDSDGTRFK